MCLRLIGDLRALILVYSTSSPITPPAQLIPTLNQLKTMVRNELVHFQTDGKFTVIVRCIILINIVNK